MSFRNKRTIILAIVAIVACALSTAMGGGVFLSLVLMVVIGIVIAIVNAGLIMVGGPRHYLLFFFEELY